jgi:cytochrome c oxidase assembly factor CtaG
MTTTDARPAPRPARAKVTGRSALLAAGYLVATAALVWYGLAAGARRFDVTGDSYPGGLTAGAEPAGYYTAALCGALCLGGLAYIVTVARPDSRGVIDEKAFRVHLLVERVAAVWAISAVLMCVVQAANDSGVAVTRLVRSTAMFDVIAASEMSRAWIVTALCAAVVAVAVRLSLRWVSHCVLMLPTLIGVVALPVSGNAASGPDHDYATSAAIVFAVALAVVTGIKAAAVLSPSGPELHARVLVAECLSGAIALVYGAMLLSLLMGSGGITATDYGRLALVAAVALALTWAGDVARVLACRRRSLVVGSGGIAAAGALATFAAMAAVSAMATQHAPRLLEHEFTSWDVLLGYALPDPPNVLRILTVWRFDTFIGVGALALAAAYLFGVVRLHRRGDRWPAGRLLSWLAGCAVLLFTSSSGVKAYGSAMFSVHMAEHMTLNMFVPILLVLGGPVTLALRALPAAGDGEPPGPREWLLWLVHSKVTAFLAHPVTAFILFVASLYLVYFTAVFDTLVRYHWGHELMSVHFLLVGYLFFWAIIGIDPGPRRLPFLGRLGLLFAVMPFHAFFGIAAMTMTSIIGGQFYRSLALPWLSSIVDDQHLGGAIAWGSSELPVIIVVVALIAQWARQDRRAAVRADRHADSSYADDELDAYNAMLRELARTRR